MKYLDNIINDNILQNYIINGDMAVYQRKGSTGSTTISTGIIAYTLDRFRVYNYPSSSPLTVTQTPVSDTERLLIGSEKLNWMSISATSSILMRTDQNIENLRQFCGKQMICSMWVVGSVGDTLTPFVYANFGTGGSDQQTVNIIESSNLTILSTGVPQKIIFTFEVPMFTGQIFGDNTTSYLRVSLVHQTSGTLIKYTGWQVNIGNSVVPFTLCARNAFDERRLCERYYEKSYPDNVSLGTVSSQGAIVGATYSISGTNYFSVLFRTPKRIAVGASVYSPSVAGNSGVVDYYTGAVISQASANSNISSTTAPRLYALSYGSTGTAQWLMYNYVADAEL